MNQAIMPRCETLSTQPPLSATAPLLTIHDGPQPRPIRRRQHARRAAAGAGRGRNRQDPRGHLPHRRVDPQPHPARADPGRHLHQQGGRRDAAARRPPCWASSSKPRPEMSTFHSLCVRILRRHIRQLGYPATFAIYDRGDQEGWPEPSCARSRWPTPCCGPAICSISSAAGKRPRFGRSRPPTLAQTDKEHLAAAAYRRYQNALKTAGAVDFDDLLLLHRGAFRQVSQGREGRGRPLRSPAGRRVPGHQRQPVSDRQGPGRRPPQSVRGGRRRPVDLRLARGRGGPHPAIQERLARGQSRAAGSQLPLDP